ncbi:MAG: hypothetical protein ACLP01_13280 [Solirubrobacteraceae bacterium]
MTAGEIAAAIALARATVSSTLSKLATSGEIQKAVRGYQLARESDTTRRPARPRPGVGTVATSPSRQAAEPPVAEPTAAPPTADPKAAAPSAVDLQPNRARRPGGARRRQRDDRWRGGQRDRAGSRARQRDALTARRRRRADRGRARLPARWRQARAAALSPKGVSI